MKKRSKKQGKVKEGEGRSSRLDLHSQTKRAIGAVGFFILALVIFFSLINRGGFVGEQLHRGLSAALGAGSWVLPVFLIGAGVVVFRSLRTKPVFSLMAGTALGIVGVTGILGILNEKSRWGGAAGTFIAYILHKLFGAWLSVIILLGFLVVALLVLLNFPLGRRHEPKEPELRLKDFLSPDIRETPRGGLLRFLKRVVPRPSFSILRVKEKTAGTAHEDLATRLKREEEFSSEPVRSKTETWQERGRVYKKPRLELLEPETGESSAGNIKANMNIIKRTLQNFGIEVEMGEVNIGPTVTQYTLKPAEGVKLAKITVLVSDLSLALASHPLRIEAPIPGKALVGIEVPNKQVKLVRLRNLLENQNFMKSPSDLLFALGRDVAGNPIFADLEKMPHLLIAGSTGSGKTISLNALVLSLLYRNSPRTLKLILIDPKRVEFPVYNGLSHLLSPVITNVNKTVSALRWLVGEMERRFEVLAAAQARDISSYNTLVNRGKRGQNEPQEYLPYLIVVVDELADLMAAKPREIESSIVRLAQMARAVGIHLVVATQRPSVEVITGLIKANITSRIAFQVASQVDSRTILDMAGAEKLLGNGDMLFTSAENAKPKRIQGAFVSESEVKRVVRHIKETKQPTGFPETESSKEAFGEQSGVENYPRLEDFDEDVTASEKDDIYEEAKKLVLETRRASASFLQRRLSVGYARAARLLDLMEEEGVVGPGEGAKPREVYGGGGYASDSSFNVPDETDGEEAEDKRAY